MNETKWLACTDKARMINFLCREPHHIATDRQFRLFACACVRRVWHRLENESDRHVIVVAENFADGLASAAAMETAAIEATSAAAWAAGNSAPGAASGTSFWAGSLDVTRGGASWNEVMPMQIGILRDIVSNPFRPRPAFSDDWRTPLALSIGTAIYQDRAETGELDEIGLLMLSDVLEDVGCTGEVLDHLRSPGPHVRGCWAIDLILGKE